MENLDPVLRSMRAEGDPADRVHQLLIETAREAASIRWDRLQAQRRGSPEAGQLCSRGISALGRVAELVLLEARLRAGDADLHPASMAKITEFFVATVKEVADSSLPSDRADMLMERFTSAIVGWESKLDEKIPPR